MKRPSLKTLPRGWRLHDGNLVRDVVLLPGATVHWLPDSFDLIDEATIQRVGAADDVTLDDDGEWSAAEFFLTHDAAQVALAARLADDLRRGVSSCPCCRCRDTTLIKRRRQWLFCVCCFQRWLAPPIDAALLIAHPTCAIRGRPKVRVPIAIGMEVFVHRRGKKPVGPLYVETVTDDDVMCLAEKPRGKPDDVIEIHAKPREIVATGKAERQTEADR